MPVKKDKKVKGGLFISFEGPEACGKSTQSRLLSRQLKLEGFTISETREPGGTPLGEKLRRIVKESNDEEIHSESELFLFCASRIQLLKNVIQPKLLRGEIIITDRFADSTTAYQGYGRGLNIDFISRLNHHVVNDCWPHITFLLDVSVETCKKRNAIRQLNSQIIDRFDSASNDFYERVRNGFLDIAAQNKNRIKVIDANDNPKTIHQKIIAQIHDAIERLSK